jgi:hypothetical protein
MQGFYKGPDYLTTRELSPIYPKVYWMYRMQWGIENRSSMVSDDGLSSMYTNFISASELPKYAPSRPESTTYLSHSQFWYFQRQYSLTDAPSFERNHIQLSEGTVALQNLRICLVHETKYNPTTNTRSLVLHSTARIPQRPHFLPQPWSFLQARDLSGFAQNDPRE